MGILCETKPSVFAYPKRLEEKKEEKKKRVETVTLSTTAKNKARLARKRAAAKEDGEAEEMDLDKREDEEKLAEEMDVEKKEDEETTEDKANEKETKLKRKKKKVPEPTSFNIMNPSRITKVQSDFCTFDLNQRYKPVRPSNASMESKMIGVIILTDSTPTEEEGELGDAIYTPGEENDRKDIPEPFEWAPPGHPDYVEGIVPKKEETEDEKDVTMTEK